MLRYAYKRLSEPWMEPQPVPNTPSKFGYKFGDKGVFEIYDTESDPKQKINLFSVPNLEEFIKDYKVIFISYLLSFML